MTEKFRKMGKYGNKCIDIMVLHYIHFRSVLMFLMPITKFRAFTGCCNLSVLSLKHLHSGMRAVAKRKFIVALLWFHRANFFLGIITAF